MSYYKKKMDFHLEQYQLAIDANKEKASAHHMREYLNYEQMFNNSRGK